MDLEGHCTDDVVCTKETFAALVCHDVRAVLTSLKPNRTPISPIHDLSSETGFLSHSYHAMFAENHLFVRLQGKGAKRGQANKAKWKRYRKRGETESGKQSDMTV